MSAGNQTNIVQIFNSENVKNKFREILGHKTPQFIASILSTINSNKLFNGVSWESVYRAAMTAAILDLPVNPSLGLAYIIPYKSQAQFQIGYRGFIQLAQRTGQYKTINVTDVHEREIKNYNRLTGEMTFSWIKDPKARLQTPVVGYIAYFKLLNGFTKSLYMTKEELENHAQTYSKQYSNGQSLWKTNFESMAQKTVIKLLISKYGPLSTQIELALLSDQAIITEQGPIYNIQEEQKTGENQEKLDKSERTELLEFIENEVESLEALLAVEKQISTPNERIAFEKKKEQLTQQQTIRTLETSSGSL